MSWAKLGTPIAIPTLMKVAFMWIGIALGGLNGHLAWGETLSHSQKLKLLKESDYGYRTRVPLTKADIPGLSGESTPEEIEFNKKILSHPQKCLFQGEDSVEAEGWVNTSRVKVIPKFTDNVARNSEEFLKACQTIKNELGPKSCSVIEIAGHANGISVGLGKILGFRVTAGKWEHFPQDKSKFKEIIQCLKDISWEEAPVVFCSCGAETCDEDFPISSMAGQSDDNLYSGGGKYVVRILYGTVNIVKRFSQSSTLLECEP